MIFMTVSMRLRTAGIGFMKPPPDTYYDLSHRRVIGHQEPLEKLKSHGILIDGEGVVDGGETKILLQIFSHGDWPDFLLNSSSERVMTVSARVISKHFSRVSRHSKSPMES